MLTDIKIGQFFPANSLLHKLDARLKIVSLFILIVGIFVFDSQLDYIIWCVLIGSLMYIKNVFYIHKANYLDYFIYFYFAFIYDTRKSYF